MDGQLHLYSNQLESDNNFSSQESYADNTLKIDAYLNDLLNDQGEKRDAYLKLHHDLSNDQGDMTMSINKNPENLDLSTEEGEIESPTYEESPSEWDSSQRSPYTVVGTPCTVTTTNGEEECFDKNRRRSSGVTYFSARNHSTKEESKKPLYGAKRKSLENWLVEGGTCPFIITGISQDIVSENKISAVNLESKSIATCRKDGIFSPVSSYNYDDLKKAFDETNFLLEARTWVEKNWIWDHCKETEDEVKLRESLERLERLHQGPFCIKKKKTIEETNWNCKETKDEVKLRESLERLKKLQQGPLGINKKKKNEEMNDDAYELELF